MNESFGTLLAHIKTLPFLGSLLVLNARFGVWRARGERWRRFRAYGTTRWHHVLATPAPFVSWQSVKGVGVVDALLEHGIHRLARPRGAAAAGVHLAAEHGAAADAAAKVPRDSKPAAKHLLLPRAVAAQSSSAHLGARVVAAVVPFQVLCPTLRKERWRDVRACVCDVV